MSVPSDLIPYQRWICWRLETGNGGKPTKVPYQWVGGKASVSWPAGWGRYREVRKAAARYDGVGFVLTRSDPFVVFDLDRCRDPKTGNITSMMMEIIREVDSYTEVSPSGTGIHIWVKGDLPPGWRKREGIEIYDSGRYITITGNHLPGTPKGIEDRTDVITALHARLSPERPGAPAGCNTATEALPERWLTLVQKNPRTRAAWEGQGKHQDRSGSGKDLFLAHEARRCGFAPEDARRIILAAPWRPEGGRGADYLDRTIARAYQAGQKRQTPAYGVAPAGPVDSGVFSRLSPSAKALYHVLCVRRMRPSGAVIRSAELLARDAGVAPKTVGPSGAELEATGLVERSRIAGGRMRYLVLLPPVQGGVREPGREATMEEKPSASPSPSVQRGVRETASPPVQGGVSASLVHEIGRAPLLAPAPPGAPGGDREIAAPPTPSLRHIWQILPTGERVVYEKRPDGELVEVGRALPEEATP